MPGAPAPDGARSVLADPARPIPDAARLGVVLVPGLFMPRAVMWPLGRYLKRDRRPTFYFDYPSRLRDVPDNALRFARWIERQGPGPYDVVTHSLGAIVVRWAAAHHDLPRLRRIVMIAPPNRGALIADRLHRRLGPLFTLIYGRTGLQLRRGKLGLAERAGVPNAQIGVIAGGTGSTRGYNPFLPGDNDFLLGVEETILGGMKDFVLVNHRHSPILFARDTAELMLRFLRTGRFRIPALDIEPAP